jgi:receptor protein-tyrosine kinase
VTVTGDTPKAAQTLAQAYGEVVPDLVDEVEAVGSQEAAQVALTVVDEPDLGRPATPGLLRSVFFGLLLGLILGIGGSVLWGAIRREDETSRA